MKKASQFTIERPILDLAPPLPVGRGLDVQLEVHVLGQGGDDEVLPAPAAAVTVLIMTAITIEHIFYTLLCCILHTSSPPTLGFNKNLTLVFFNYLAQDASILKISVPIIKRWS